LFCNKLGNREINGLTGKERGGKRRILSDWSWDQREEGNFGGSVIAVGEGEMMEGQGGSSSDGRAPLLVSSKENIGYIGGRG